MSDTLSQILSDMKKLERRIAKLEIGENNKYLMTQKTGYIGDTANAGMTLGLTINQGAADDEILALKSSDIAHGITTNAETDTYYFIKKVSATAGGALVTGVTETTQAHVVRGYATTESTTKSTAAYGCVEIRGALKSGTTVGDMGTDANVLAVRNNATTGLLVDAEGDLWIAGNLISVYGHAIQLVAGENLSKGEVVYIKVASGADGKVWKNPIDSDMPIGVVLADASANAAVYVVVGGIAEVLPNAGDTATRGYVIYSSSTTAGRVDQSAALPAVASHNREIGHWLDTGSGNGAITRAVLHFN